MFAWFLVDGALSRDNLLTGNRLLRLYSLNYTAGGIELDDLDPAQDAWQGGLVQVNIATRW